MRKKVFIGIALLLVAGLLASCGGVSQEELDAALADKTAAQAQVTSLQSQLAAANTAKTTAEAALATANTAKTAAEAALAAAEADLEEAVNNAQIDKAALQVQLSDAQTKLAAAEAALAAAEAKIEELEAAGGVIAPPILSFDAAEYVNETLGFTFKYKKIWTATWESANNPVSFGDATYYDPSVRIYILPEATGATLADVLKSATMKTELNITSTVVIDEEMAEMTNVYGTTATPVKFHFTWADGATAQSMAYGFIKDGNWYILFLTISSGWNLDVTTLYPDEVFSTWSFK